MCLRRGGNGRPRVAAKRRPCPECTASLVTDHWQLVTDLFIHLIRHTDSFCRKSFVCWLVRDVFPAAQKRIENDLEVCREWRGMRNADFGMGKQRSRTDGRLSAQGGRGSLPYAQKTSHRAHRGAATEERPDELFTCGVVRFIRPTRSFCGKSFVLITSLPTPDEN